MTETPGRGQRLAGAAAALALVASFAWFGTPAAPGDTDRGAGKRGVVFVANAEGGTVSVVDVRRLEVVREIDVLPDGPTADTDPDSAAGQKIIEAAGGLNYVQDQDVSPDGRILYVSRGHRADVAAFRIRTGEMLWKAGVDGLRADHMELSHDGATLYVSALTANLVHVLDARTGDETGRFGTGQWPHDNHLTHDGSTLYNASIGMIVAPEPTRGPDSYVLTAVDPKTLEVKRKYTFEAGIRPYVLSEDERKLYAQLSEYHGVVEFDLGRGEITRRLDLPIDQGVTEDDYDFEAPHHGLALSGDGETLCAAGRASDYVALIDADRMRTDAIIGVGDAPGWAATGPGGRRCFVPNTRADQLSVISFRSEREVARLDVGDGPKHIEAARVPRRILK
jgi:DNA-binding beta-propeller fold protein YncE